MRVKRTGTALVLALLLAACGGQEPVGEPVVYDRIAQETDCTALQRQFDQADANQSRERGNGRTELADANAGYMRAADDRMREVGCYR